MQTVTINASNNNRPIKVDSDRYNELIQHKWAAMEYGASKKAYAVTQIPIEGGGQRSVYMHRLLTGAKQGELVTHINGDSLDNTVSNLKVVKSLAEIERDLTKKVWGSSGFYGVHPLKNGKWRAQVTVDRKPKYLGQYPTAQRAAMVVNEAIFHYSLKKQFNIIDNLEFLESVKEAGTVNVKAFEAAQSRKIKRRKPAKKKPSKRKAKYTGVSFTSKGQKFKAQIWVGSRVEYLGSYDTVEMAAFAYNEAILRNNYSARKPNKINWRKSLTPSGVKLMKGFTELGESGYFGVTELPGGLFEARLPQEEGYLGFGVHASAYKASLELKKAIERLYRHE